MNGALCRVASVMPANMGVMERIAGGFVVNCESMGVVLALPLLNEGRRRQSGGAVELS